LLLVAPDLVAGGAQLALLGSGDADLERGFAAMAQSHQGSVGVELGYDEALSHLIIGGADVLVMPSRFEPGGLTQLYALRYGTLPLVRRVGGLADTVVGADALSLADGTATGFTFDVESPQALGSAIEGAAVLFRQRAIWRQMIRRAMTRDFSWDAAARQYLALYRDLRPDLPT
jgi:starch synthase